jgi:hypothetical protein
MNNQGNKYTTKILGMKGSHTCPTEKTIQTWDTIQYLRYNSVFKIWKEHIKQIQTWDKISIVILCYNRESLVEYL